MADRFKKIYVDTLSGKWHVFNNPELNPNIKNLKISTEIPLQNWYILHNMGINDDPNVAVSEYIDKFIVQVYDDANNSVWPDEIIIEDENILLIKFSVPFKGRVNLMFFR